MSTAIRILKSKVEELENRFDLFPEVIKDAEALEAILVRKEIIEINDAIKVLEGN